MGGARRSLFTASILLAGFTLYRWQFSVDTVIEGDSLYHIGMSNLLRERGIVREFPWLQLWVLRDRFADKDFLFHVAMLPFTGRGYDADIEGSKQFITILGLGVLAMFGYFLKRHEVPGAWLWMAALAAASAHWMFRFTMIRPHVLSIGLFLAVLYTLLSGRWKRTAALSFVYAWSYIGWHLILVLAIGITVARRLFEKQWVWPPLAAAAGGLAAGILINPYFPNNVCLWWYQSVEVAAHAWGGAAPHLVVPTELRPLEWRFLLALSMGAWMLWAGSVACLLIAPKRLSWEARAVVLLSGGCLVPYLLSERMVEYFVPVTVYAAALVFRDLHRAGLASKKLCWSLGACLAAALIWINGRYSLKEWGDRHVWEARAVEWIREHVPAGQTIGHLDFDQFPPLFVRDREHYYFSGMDPMFTRPKEAEYLARLSGRQERANPYLLSDMGARYLILEKRRHEWHMQWLQEAHAVKVFEDSEAAVFELPLRSK
jgi:hypothetical protein